MAIICRIYSITYSDKYQRATLRNNGCNYRCIGCSYKLKSPEKPVSHLSLDSIRDCLRSLPLREVSFMGGEPTLNPELPELLSFCKNELGILTRLGHTNGSNLIIINLDASNVTLKAYDDELYLDYTGKPAGPVMGADILLFDEPTSDLDPAARRYFVNIMKSLRESGKTVVLVEHNWTGLESVIDRAVFMSGGMVVSDSPFPSEKPVERRVAPWHETADTAVALKGVSFAYRTGQMILEDITVEIKKGEIVGICGVNGCGKTTLLKLIAGILQTVDGKRTIAGLDNPSLDEMVGRIGYVFQNPDDQIFTDSAASEVAFGPENMGIHVDVEEIANSLIKWYKGDVERKNINRGFRKLRVWQDAPRFMLCLAAY